MSSLHIPNVQILTHSRLLMSCQDLVRNALSQENGILTGELIYTLSSISEGSSDLAELTSWMLTASTQTSHLAAETLRVVTTTRQRMATLSQEGSHVLTALTSLKAAILTLKYAWQKLDTIFGTWSPRSPQGCCSQTSIACLHMLTGSTEWIQSHTCLIPSILSILMDTLSSIDGLHNSLTGTRR